MSRALRNTRRSATRSHPARGGAAPDHPRIDERVGFAALAETPASTRQTRATQSSLVTTLDHKRNCECHSCRCEAAGSAIDDRQLDCRPPSPRMFGGNTGCSGVRFDKISKSNSVQAAGQPSAPRREARGASRAARASRPDGGAKCSRPGLASPAVQRRGHCLTKESAGLAVSH